MFFVLASFDEPEFAGDVYYRFEDDSTYAQTSNFVDDYIKNNFSWEQISEDEWVEAEGWPMYIAYPEFGNTFIFAVDADLDENDEIADVILSNCQSWDYWNGAMGRM